MGGHLYIAELKIQQLVHIPCCNFGQQICQQAIKADGGGQTCLSRDARWQSRKVLDRMTGVVLVSFFEKAACVFEGNFFQGSDV